MATDEREYHVVTCSNCGRQCSRNHRDRWKCPEHGDGIMINRIDVVPKTDVEAAEQKVADAERLLQGIYAKVARFDPPLSSHLSPGPAIDALIAKYEAAEQRVRGLEQVIAEGATFEGSAAAKLATAVEALKSVRAYAQAPWMAAERRENPLHQIAATANQALSEIKGSDDV